MIDYTYLDHELHCDDRRRAANDLFPFPKGAGQVNLSYIYPGAIAAWHRHKKQADYWYCVKGSLRVGLYSDHLEWAYLSEWSQRGLYIPPGVWHGYKNIGTEEAVLLYWVTEKYNRETPDEERTVIGSFGESWDMLPR